MKEFVSNASGRSLVLIDDNPLRASASREFKKLYDACARHRSEIAHHEATVRPSYFRWLIGLFGERINRLERLQMEIIQKSALLQRMRELCIFDGFSRGAAFEQAQQEFDFENAGDEEEGESFEPDEDANSGFKEDESDDGSSEGFFGGSGDEWRDFFEQPAAPRAKPETGRESRIKYYYRKLVHALHPDLGGAQTELGKEFWQDTQDAYKGRDLDRLEMIWTLVSIQTDAASREVRLSDLRKAVEHMKEKLRLVKKEKRRLSRDDPSWGFEKKDKSKIEREIGTDLDSQEGVLQMTLDDLEDDLAVFERSKGDRRRKSRGREKRMPYEY